MNQTTGTLERERETNCIAAALDTAASGNGRVVIIEGPAGGRLGRRTRRGTAGSRGGRARRRARSFHGGRPARFRASSRTRGGARAAEARRARQHAREGCADSAWGRRSGVPDCGTSCPGPRPDRSQTPHCSGRQPPNFWPRATRIRRRASDASAGRDSSRSRPAGRQHHFSTDRKPQTELRTIVDAWPELGTDPARLVLAAAVRATATHFGILAALEQGNRPAAVGILSRYSTDSTLRTRN